MDEKIAQLTQKGDLLARYKKGVMQQIFSQQLRFKDDDGREFPEWEEKELGDVLRLFRGMIFRALNHQKNGIMVIKLILVVKQLAIRKSNYKLLLNSK